MDGWGGDYLIAKSTFVSKKYTKYYYGATLQISKTYT